MKMISIKRHCLVVLVICLAGTCSPVFAQDADLQETLKRMEQLLQQQQQELKAQRAELAEQKALIQQLQKAQGNLKDQVDEQFVAEEPSAPTEAEKMLNADLEVSPDKTETALAKSEETIKTEDGDGDSSAFYDPSNTIYDKEFPGAWQMPGTTAAMRIGGYVNLTVINSFDPLLISDRCITGSIPPEGEDVPGARSGTDVTANQTRVNLEVRQRAGGRMLRAFIEGDFEGSGDAFRLRHAFGQYRAMLAGKTWTSLMDVDSRPEEVDFEGINGQVLLRQSQLRFSPRFGENMHFKIGIESPQTDVVNGTGNRGHSDVIVSMDRLPLGQLGSWNSRVGFIYRDLKAQDVDAGDDPGEDFASSSATGWGITTSGRKPLDWWGGDDFLLWQLTYGEGIGRYINDLGTVGGGDAVFDPEGKLHALPVFAGYFSYQHRWPKQNWLLKDLPGQLRSNLTMSWVNISNFDFQEGKNYDSTHRISANLIYQPAQKIRLGMEFLWGERKNKDNSKGTASQIQMSARYDF